MITIKKTEWGLIKANAKASRTYVDAKARNLAKIEELQKENERLSKQIASMQSYVVSLTGHTTEDLTVRVITPTGKFDKDGREIKKYEYVPNASLVTYDEEKKVYVLNDSLVDEGPTYSAAAEKAYVKDYVPSFDSASITENDDTDSPSDEAWS